MLDKKDSIEEYEAELAELDDRKRELNDWQLVHGWNRDLFHERIRIQKRVKVLLESIEALKGQVLSKTK